MPLPPRIDVDRAVELYVKGASVKDIAADLRCSKATIYTHLNRRNVPIRGVRAPRHPARTEDLLRLRKEGRTFAEIAELTGMSEPGALSRVKAVRQRAATTGQVHVDEYRQRLDAAWDDRWNRVFAHAQQTGQWPTSNHTDPDLGRLGQWFAVQRGLWRKGDLRADRAQVLISAGVPRYSPPGRPLPPCSPETAAQIVSDYLGGDSLETLARRHGLSVEHTRSLIAAADEPIRRRRPQYSNPQLLQLADQGLPNRDIAKMLGIRPNTVAVRLRRARANRS